MIAARTSHFHFALTVQNNIAVVRIIAFGTQYERKRGSTFHAAKNELQLYEVVP